MPDLSNTVRWLEYEPDLLGNRESARPFYFRLHGSMSKAQMKALADALAARGSAPEPEKLPEKPTDEQRAEHEKAMEEYNELARATLVAKYASALEPFVKLGEEPLSFDGQPVDTLRAYFDFVTVHLAGLEAFFEPYRALLNVNTLGAASGFFSGRLSGGFTSTGSRRSASPRSQKAAH